MQPNVDAKTYEIVSLYEWDEPSFWEAYEEFMATPVDEGETLQAVKEFVEGENAR